MAEASEKRGNRALWLGFLFTVFGPVSNGLYFLGFPAVPVVWIGLLLPACGLVFLVIGLRRAFLQSSVYGGKVWGSIATGLSVLVLAASVGFSYVARHIPAASAGMPHVGQRVPDFTLPDSDGNPVSLSQLLLGSGGGAAPKAVLLVFYRGYW